MDCGQLPPGFQVQVGLPGLMPLVPLAVQNETKVVRTSSKFEKDDRVTILPRLPDVLVPVLEVEDNVNLTQTLHQSLRHPLHPPDQPKVS